MAKSRKKGPAPNTGKPAKKQKSVSRILYTIFAIFMALLMVVPYVLSLFQ